MTDIGPVIVTLFLPPTIPFTKAPVGDANVEFWYRSNVNFTSAALKGLPSCHVTPGRRVTFHVVPSGLEVQPGADGVPLARSGIIVLKIVSFLRAKLLNISLETARS